MVLDLDWTLADLHTFFFFIMSLRLKEYLITNRPFMVPFVKPELEEQLRTAYVEFVLRIVQEERSPHPLGLLRTGLLPLMEQLADLHKTGRVHQVILYSNNRCLESLELVRDVIHMHLQYEMIQLCSHWDDPRRTLDKVNPEHTKTWMTMKSLLQHLGASDFLHPMDVLFFDDQHHPNVNEILHSNDHRVPPYQFRCSIERVTQLFLQSMDAARTNVTEWTLIVLDILESNDPHAVGMVSTEEILLYFTYLVGHTALPHEIPPKCDNAVFEQAFELISSAPARHVSPTFIRVPDSHCCFAPC